MYHKLSSVLFLTLLSAPAQSALNTRGYNIPQSSQTIFSHPDDIFTSIREALLDSAIIPEVVNDFIPSCLLAPYYGKKHRSVTLGNEIKPGKVQIPPSLKVWCPEMKEDADGKEDGLKALKGLTIVLTDPDAPSRESPEWSEVCHWIAKVPLKKNIAKHGEADLDGWEISVERGGVEDLVEYKPPGPPPKTGYHRYVFVLLAGDNKNLTAPEERKNWGTGKERHGVKQWAEEQGLVVLGANYFVSKNKKQK